MLFVVLTLLFWFTPARLRPGVLSGVFGIGYGLSRYIIENYREPDRQLGILGSGLTMGQTLTLPIIRDKVDGIILVSEVQLEQAISLYVAIEKTVTETGPRPEANMW